MILTSGIVPESWNEIFRNSLNMRNAWFQHVCIKEKAGTFPEDPSYSGSEAVAVKEQGIRNKKLYWIFVIDELRKVNQSIPHTI